MLAKTVISKDSSKVRFPGFPVFSRAGQPAEGRRFHRWEKVNSVEKLARQREVAGSRGEVNRRGSMVSAAESGGARGEPRVIVDRGLRFAGVFCTDATIATVRSARSDRRPHMSSLASYGLDSHASRAVIHHCQSLHWHSRSSGLRTRIRDSLDSRDPLLPSRIVNRLPPALISRETEPRSSGEAYAQLSAGFASNGSPSSACFNCIVVFIEFQQELWEGGSCLCIFFEGTVE